MSAGVPSLTSRFDLRDRHVVVTGAASGLGLAICQGLLELGAHVTAIDLDGNALTTASTAFGAPDDRFSLRVCDVADHEAIASAIADGPIRTNIGGSGPIPEDIERKWSSTVLLGRMGSPHEIQGLANLLASDASSFMTGVVIALDGGGTSGYFATLPAAGG